MQKWKNYNKNKQNTGGQAKQPLMTSNSWFLTIVSQ